MPVTQNAPPGEGQIALEIRNLMTRCPYVDLEIAAEIYGVTDIESLILQMLAIEKFIQGD